MLKVTSTIKIIQFFDMISCYFLVLFSVKVQEFHQKSFDKRSYQEYYWIGKLDSFFAKKV